MTSQVGPVPLKADNQCGLFRPLTASGSRCAEIHNGPASYIESHNEAGYTTAIYSDRLQRYFVSTCGRSPYTTGYMPSSKISPPAVSTNTV